MPITVRGETYYRTKEVCHIVGISRTTFLRWLENGIVGDASHRDRRGWRLFTEADMKRIEVEANKVK